MNIENENLDRARKLLKELKKLEDANDVLKNYDASVSAVFRTLHNSNLKELKEVYISMPPDICKAMREYITNKIYEIKKELESL